MDLSNNIYTPRTCWITSTGIIYKLINSLDNQDNNKDNFENYDTNSHKFLLENAINNDIITDCGYFKISNNNDFQLFDEETYSFSNNITYTNGKLLSDHHLIEFNHRDNGLYNIITWNTLHHESFNEIYLKTGLIQENNNIIYTKTKNKNLLTYNITNNSSIIKENDFTLNEVYIERYNKIIDIIFDKLNNNYDIICLQECEDYILDRLKHKIKKFNIKWNVHSNKSKTWNRVILYNTNSFNQQYVNTRNIHRHACFETYDSIFLSSHLTQNLLANEIYELINTFITKENIFLIGDFNKNHKYFIDMFKQINNNSILIDKKENKYIKLISNNKSFMNTYNINSIKNNIITYNSTHDPYTYYYKINIDNYIDGYIHITKLKYDDSYTKFNILPDILNNHNKFMKVIMVNYYSYIENKLQEENNKLQENTKLEEDKTKLKKNLKALDKKFSLLKQENTKLVEDKTKLEEDNNKLQEENKKKSSKNIKELNKKINKLEQENNRLRKSNNKIQQDINKIKKPKKLNIDKLREDIQKLIINK